MEETHDELVAYLLARVIELEAQIKVYEEEMVCIALDSLADKYPSCCEGTI